MKFLHCYLNSMLVLCMKIVNHYNVTIFILGSMKNLFITCKKFNKKKKKMHLFHRIKMHDTTAKKNMFEMKII